MRSPWTLQFTPQGLYPDVVQPVNLQTLHEHALINFIAQVDRPNRDIKSLPPSSCPIFIKLGYVQRYAWVYQTLLNLILMKLLQSFLIKPCCVQELVSANASLTRRQAINKPVPHFFVQLGTFSWPSCAESSLSFGRDLSSSTSRTLSGMCP